MDLATWTLAALTGAEPNLRTDFAPFQTIVFHATSGEQLRQQLQQFSAGPNGVFGLLLIDARGSNAGGVYEVQLGIFQEAAGFPLEIAAWTWEVFEDSSAFGMNLQIGRWLNELRTSPEIDNPWLMVLSQAGAGDGTRFVTIAAWVDVGPEPPPSLAESLARVMRRAPAPVEPEPEPEPELEPIPE